MLSVAAPAFALTGEQKLSRRLVRSEAILRQRIPSGAMPVEALLRIRKEAKTDATGLSQLSRARWRTVGETMKFRDGFPSRRTIRSLTEDQGLLVLPPSIVETGKRVRANRMSRRVLVIKARHDNRVEVAPVERTIPVEPVVPAVIETPAAPETK